MDDDGCPCEVEARPPCFERHEEHRGIVLVECVHELEALFLRSCPREGVVGDALIVEPLRNEREKTGELREDEHLFACIDRGIDEFGKRVELGGPAFVVLVQQMRVAA